MLLVVRCDKMIREIRKTGTFLDDVDYNHLNCGITNNVKTWQATHSAWGLSWKRHMMDTHKM